MLRRLLQASALLLLWVANLMLVASFWTNAIGLGFFGILIGGVFGLPIAYFWFMSDRLAFARFDEHIRPVLERLAGRRRTIDQPAARKAVAAHAVFDDDGIELPVRVIEHKQIEEAHPPAVVKVDVEVDDADREAWEAKKAADAEYERLRNTIPGLSFDDVVSFIEHDDPRVRLAVVQHLRHMEDARIQERLRLALDDNNVVVRRAARLALEERHI